MKNDNRLAVAQVVDHRAASMREVVSSTPAGPTLRVLTLLMRKCCLCNSICKWLDFEAHRPRLTLLAWNVKEPTHCSKRVGDVVPVVVVSHLFCSAVTCVNYLFFS